MDIERSIKYVFEDPEWLQKLLIGAVVNIVPIVNFAAIGYALDEGKQVIDGHDTPLPSWSNFGEQFVKGLMVVIASFIYYLPMIIVACVISVISAAFQNSSGASSAAASLISVCGGIFYVIYGIAAGVVLPAALTRYVVTGEFASMFRFNEVFAYIRDNISNYVLAIIAMIVISIVAAIVGTLACVIGLLFTSFWAYLIYVHLFAQVYVESKGKPTVEVSG